MAHRQDSETQSVQVVTLMQVGWSMQEAQLVLARVMQRVKAAVSHSNHPLEYAAVLRTHPNFELDGFCWHLFIQNDEPTITTVMSRALQLATGGRSSTIQVQYLSTKDALLSAMSALMNEQQLTLAA